ncbi:hypothetical protein LG293_17135 (plasmid) [Citricoccus nitrophenolicus]
MPENAKPHDFRGMLRVFKGPALHKSKPLSEESPSADEAKEQHLADLVKANIVKVRVGQAGSSEHTDHEAIPIDLTYEQHFTNKRGITIPLLFAEGHGLVGLDILLADQDDRGKDQGAGAAGQHGGSPQGAEMPTVLPEGVGQLPDGRFFIELASRGMTVATESLTQALTIRDADDVVTTARKSMRKRP